MAYDESEHIKEVYAHFGLAIYLAQCVEHTIVNGLFYTDLLPDVLHKVKGREPFTKQDWEAAFDAFRDQRFRLTLGNMFKTFKKSLPVDQELEDKLIFIKQNRYFLAHQFFRVRAQEFISRVGRDKMIKELKQYQESFEEVDGQLSALIAQLPKPQWVQKSLKNIGSIMDRWYEAAEEEDRRSVSDFPRSCGRCGSIAPSRRRK